jgi:hypothetical protein
MYAGCPVSRRPPPSAIELATAKFRNTLERSANAGLQLTEDESDELRRWFHPEIPSEHP